MIGVWISHQNVTNSGGDLVTNNRSAARQSTRQPAIRLWYTRILRYVWCKRDGSVMNVIVGTVRELHLVRTC